MHVHHLAFRTNDVERLATFYAMAFGLGEAQRHHDPQGLRAVWLSLDGAVLMIERREPNEPAVPAGSMEFLAFATGADALPAWRARFAREGVAIEHATEFTLYVRDPDGRRVGVSAYKLT